MMDKALVAVMHYRMPSKDNYTFFIPANLSIIDGDRDTAYILDCCSIPVTKSTLLRRLRTQFDNCYSELELNNQIRSMIQNGLLIYSSNQRITTKKAENPQLLIPHDDYRNITLHLTDRCNLECLYCYNKTERMTHQHSELRASDWKPIIDDILANSVSGHIDVTLSGGEPLLYDEIYEVTRFLKERNSTVGMITNGTIRPNENIDKLIGLLDSVTVSIDSHIEKVNDLTRGVGTYKKIIKFIKYLEKKNVDYAINSVLTSHNIETYHETLKVFRKIFSKAKRIQPIVQEASHNAPGIKATKSQMDDYMDYFYVNEMIKDTVERDILNDTTDALLYRVGCSIAAREFALAPDGSLLPCRAIYFSEMSAGKLNGKNFNEIWNNSDVLNRVRKANNDRIAICKGQRCDFYSLCLGGCLAHSYGMTGELKPFSSDDDCYRFRQDAMMQMKLKLMKANNEI